MTQERYIKGYKFCTSCHKWVEAGAEIYYPTSSKAARCPNCRRILKSEPRGNEAKEKLAKMTTGRELVRY